MDLQLKGKTAVVTGATRGIGRAIAECFADEGANVAICARNADQVAETARALEAKGVKAFGQVVDIADGPALKAFITKAGETLGGIDILVSNASALVQGNAEDAWKAMFDIDMMGAVRTFEVSSVRSARTLVVSYLHFALLFVSSFACLLLSCRGPFACLRAC